MALNISAELLTESSDMEILGKNIDEIFYLIDDKKDTRLESLFQKVIAEGSSEALPNHCTLVSITGKNKHVLGHVRPVLDKSKQTIGVTYIFQQPDPVQAESEALDKSLTLSSALIENSSSIIYIKDLDRQYTLVNNIFTQIFDLPRESIINKSDYDIFPKAQSDTQKEEEDKVLNSKFPLQKTDTIEIAGKSHEFLATRFPLIDAQGNPYAIGGILVDITQRKAIELERSSLEEQLRISQRLESIGVMAGGIAHDFNNILQSIYLYMGIVMGHLEEDHPAYPDSVNVLEAAMRARNLVDNIFTFSTQESGNLRPLALQHVLKLSIKFLRSMLPSSIELKVDIDDNCGMILGDAALAHQILISLVNNAEYAMRGTQGKLEIILLERTEKDFSEQEKVIELIVRDSGHGMEQDIKQKIFDPFFTTKEPGEGSGLGLSVLFGIVRDMNGQIYADSQPNEGSSFHLIFPCLPDVEVSSLFPNTSEEDVINRVLFVDDEENIAQAGKLVLENYGATVQLAYDGAEALAMIEGDTEGFDLVITDQIMPKLTGLQLIKKIRKISPTLPIILTCGSIKPIEEQNIQELGNVEYLPKPWVPQQLVDTVKTFQDS